MFYPKIPKCYIRISPNIRNSYYFLLPPFLSPRFSLPLQFQFFETVKEKEIHYITIRNAKVNNLKGISLRIPKNKLVVITGLSGSGKSSLAFDTLYAEGQRRYVESGHKTWDLRLYLIWKRCCSKWTRTPRTWAIWHCKKLKKSAKAIG